MTLRLPDEMADDLGLVARLDGVSRAEVMRTALGAHLRERLRDDVLRGRLADAHAAERERLQRQADNSS